MWRISDQREGPARRAWGEGVRLACTNSNPPHHRLRDDGGDGLAGTMRSYFPYALMSWRACRFTRSRSVVLFDFFTGRKFSISALSPRILQSHRAMAAIGSLVFCTNCGNLLDGSIGKQNAILTCSICLATCKGIPPSRTPPQVSRNKTLN